MITIGGSAVSLAVSPTVAAVGMIFLATQSLGPAPALLIALVCGMLITGVQGAVVGYAGANPVVLTGDNHSNWVNDLRVDDLQPKTRVVATEFVGTSISSGGNGSEHHERAKEIIVSCTW
jgi:hypothetical protein